MSTSRVNRRRPSSLKVSELPRDTAFTGSVEDSNGITHQGLFYVCDQSEHRSTMLVRICEKEEGRFPYYGNKVQVLSVLQSGLVTDYDGPLDLRVTVRGYSQWDGKLLSGRGFVPMDLRGNALTSDIIIRPEKEKPLKGPRKVRFRDDHEEEA